MQQDVRCFKKLTGEIESIGSIREGYVVIKSTLFREKKSLEIIFLNSYA